jgi:NADP-reducing hydrogenase subunit HndB
MGKLKPEDLDKISEKVRHAVSLREGAGRAKVVVHLGTCGIAAGARKVMSALLDEIEKQKVTDVLVTTSGCAGLCSREPMITVELLGTAPVKYADVNEEKMRQVFRRHVMGGQVVKEYALAAGSERTR